MRKGIITASNIKKLISLKDLNNTADTMIAKWNKQNTAIILAIQYGIDNKLSALKKLGIQHRIKHRKCTSIQPDLIVSPDYPYIGSSPDAIFYYNSCGKFIVEVKWH